MWPLCCYIHSVIYHSHDPGIEIHFAYDRGDLKVVEGNFRLSARPEYKFDRFYCIGVPNGSVERHAIKC